jgi:hypothetical protein
MTDIEAQQLIETARLNRSTNLCLNSNLTVIPESIGDLTSLVTLNISGN